MEREYLNRIIEKELDLALTLFGAVQIVGTKWCGKTWTAEKRSSSVIYLQDVRKYKQYQDAAKVAPDLLLEGDTPRLIDEWQTIPILWDGVRFEVDKRKKRGQFILTGSSIPSNDVVMHTGTGRIAKLLMRPMSLYESLESDGSVSLASVFENEDIRGETSLGLKELAYVLVRGGWPESIGEKDPGALKYARQYVTNIINSDVSKVDDIERDPERIRKLMQSIARNVSMMVKKKTIMDDITGNEMEDKISDKTFRSYLNALEHLFVVENLPAWSPSIRSRIHLRTSPKYHFVDPSIAAVLLRVSPASLMNDFNTFGLLFESLCIRDLRVYAQSIEGELFHYRDGDDLEVDAIIHLFDGRWGAVEIKMGVSEIDKAADNLKKLRDKVDRDEMGGPSFLMVITAMGYAYRRDDGVYVVPITCLKD